MSEISRNKMSWRIMIPVMLFAVMQAAPKAFSSVIANIAQDFPNESTTLVQMVLTLPTLMIIPISIIIGLLASYVTKKNLVIFALACELIGGIMPTFLHKTISALLVSSALIGVGEGFLISLASAVLAEYFDGNTRGKALGFKEAASSLGIAGLTVVIGFLARGAWYNTYYVYLLIVPILILTAIMLPKGKKDVKILGKGVGSEGAKRVFSPSMIYLCIFYFFLGAFSFAFYTNVGMSIISKGLGDSSVVGLTTAWNSVLTIVIGIGFGVVLRMFKKFTLMSSLIITAVAYLIMVVGQNLWAITLGCILYGVGQGIQMPASVFYITEAVDSESSTMAIGISMAMTALGITLSPVVVNAFAAISGPLDGTTGLMVAGVAYGVLSAVELIRESVFNKYSKIGWAEKPKVTAE